MNEEYEINVELPYYPTALKHQKAGMLGVRTGFHIDEFVDAATVLETFKRKRKLLREEWVRLAVDIEGDPEIMKRVQMGEGYTREVIEPPVSAPVETPAPITPDKPPESDQGKGKEAPPIDRPKEDKPPEKAPDAGSERRYPGPEYMFMLEADDGGKDGWEPLCGMCKYTGTTSPLDPNDIDFSRTRYVPMALCGPHRTQWFGTKNYPEKRRELRERFDEVYYHFKAKEGYRWKEGMKAEGTNNGTSNAGAGSACSKGKG